MSVLVWIEQSKSGPVANSFEVLGKAREIASAMGTQSVAAVVGGDTSVSAAEAGRYGLAQWRRIAMFRRSRAARSGQSYRSAFCLLPARLSPIAAALIYFYTGPARTARPLTRG